MMSPPKVFISHSSADKDRFVTNFASRLRNDGVDAWYDKWEILPGDSLVDKIFNEGIDRSDIVILVISENSINSRWVKEELNTVVIKRIEGKCRIVPIIIDNCVIPICLKNTLYEKIDDLENYEENYRRIHASIFSHSIKPPIGEEPNYLKSINFRVEELLTIDNWILEAICRHAINSQYPSLIMTSIFHQEAIESGITDEQINDSLDFLTSSGYLHDALNEGGNISAVKIPSHILEIYCRNCVKDYENCVLSVISSIVNDNIMENHEISASTGISIGIVTHILIFLNDLGKFRISTAMGGTVIVIPANLLQIKRMLM